MNDFHRPRAGLTDVLRRAGGLVRQGDPGAATRAIQDALGKAGLTGGATPPGTDGAGANRPGTGGPGGWRETLRAAAASATATAARPGTGPVRATARPAPDAPIAPGARIVRGRLESRHGARDWRLYVPSAAAAGAPLPLVVMLHGCTQDADDFARGTRMDAVAEAANAFVLYPEQSAKANPQRCWNWFKHTHQDAARGEPAIVAAMVRHVAGAHAIDASRVFAAGLSAGGAMAAILGECAPETFAGVGIHSGLGAGAAGDMPSAFAAMRGQGAPVRAPRVPTIVFHGDADATVDAANADRIVEAVAARASGALRRVETVRANGREAERETWSALGEGAPLCERWTVRGAGHAWSGGDPAGSYTDASGPDASALMMDFFAGCASGSARAA